MTRKPIQCPACASELSPEFIRKAANAQAASAKRPGNAGNKRNPYGRKGKPVGHLSDNYACHDCAEPRWRG